MKLSDIVVKGAVRPALEATTRDDAIAELVKALADAGKITKTSVPQIIESTIARENQATTGVGKGIALPHAKMKGIKKPIATIGKSAEGLDFSSLDNQPVFAVILLLSNPDNPADHLKAMEIIFGQVQRDMFRKFLLQAETTEAVMDLVKEADEES
jgi:mannitol/fructose-specific phosphotransferase system IIA component (Ntr-type)